jgi:hypothetical protein
MRHGLALLVCGTLVLAACGGDDDDVKDALGGASQSNGGGGKTSLPGDAGDAGGGTGDAPDLPEDICKVLPEDTVQALVPGYRVDGPKNVAAQGMATADCGWVNDTVTLTLNFTAGVPEATLEASLEGDAKDQDGAELTTIGGDEASVEKLITNDMEITVVHGDVQVTLNLLSLNGDAPQHKDELVTLAEAAVGSL